MLTFYSADLNGNITGQPDIYRGGGDGLNARTSIFGTPGNKEYIILESDMWSEAGVDRGITNFRKMCIRDRKNPAIIPQTEVLNSEVPKKPKLYQKPSQRIISQPKT